MMEIKPLQYDDAYYMNMLEDMDTTGACNRINSLVRELRDVYNPDGLTVMVFDKDCESSLEAARKVIDTYLEKFKLKGSITDPDTTPINRGSLLTRPVETKAECRETEVNTPTIDLTYFGKIIVAHNIAPLTYTHWAKYTEDNKDKPTWYPEGIYEWYGYLKWLSTQSIVHQCASNFILIAYYQIICGVTELIEPYKEVLNWTKTQVTNSTCILYQYLSDIISSDLLENAIPVKEYTTVETAKVEGSPIKESRTIAASMSKDGIEIILPPNFPQDTNEVEKAGIVCAMGVISDAVRSTEIPKWYSRAHMSWDNFTDIFNTNKDIGIRVVFCLICLYHFSKNERMYLKEVFEKVYEDSKEKYATDFTDLVQVAQV